MKKIAVCLTLDVVRIISVPDEADELAVASAGAVAGNEVMDAIKDHIPEVDMIVGRAGAVMTHEDYLAISGRAMSAAAAQALDPAEPIEPSPDAVLLPASSSVH